jgi:hypothetical protein
LLLFVRGGVVGVDAAAGAPLLLLAGDEEVPRSLAGSAVFDMLGGLACWVGC